MNEFIPVKYEQYEAFIGRLFSPAKQGKDNSKTVTIQVTDACNLACTYCYQTNKNTHVMPVEIGKKFIDDLLDGKYNNYCDYSNSESVVLEFIGGEPWLCIDLIDELTDYFIQGLIDRNHPWLHRFRLSICSNGVLHFDPKVQSYLRKHNRHLSYSISIDGNKELHDACRIFPDGSGSYDLAIAGVEDYMNTYLGRMGSKMTLAPSNISYTYEATKSLIEKGYKDINLNCVYEEGWTAEHGRILYQQLKLLADYIIENNLYQELDISIFTQGAFGPKDPEDLKNWCWAAGTPILTTSGYKPIEELKIGDMVYTEDGTIHPIVNTMSHFADNVVDIKVSGAPKMTCTDNHKLFTIPFDYIDNDGVSHYKEYCKTEVKDIRDNDLLKLFTLPTDYTWVSGLKTTKAEPQMVYNITVQDNHSYIAGGIASANCGGTGAMLAVDWKGDLYPCIRYMESSLNDIVEPYIIGNVNTGILVTEEQCAKCSKLNDITRRSQSTDECFNCPIADGCAWCSAYNYQMNGTPDSRCTFICIMHKARALANAYYWNKIYRIENVPKRHKLYIPEEWAMEIISLEEWKFLNLLAQP